MSYSGRDSDRDSGSKQHRQLPAAGTTSVDSGTGWVPCPCPCFLPPPLTLNLVLTLILWLTLTLMAVPVPSVVLCPACTLNVHARRVHHNRYVVQPSRLHGWAGGFASLRLCVKSGGRADRVSNIEHLSYRARRRDGRAICVHPRDPRFIRGRVDGNSEFRIPNSEFSRASGSNISARCRCGPEVNTVADGT